MMGGDEWKAAKGEIMPFANLPYLIDGDLKISETFAVHQYIAQKWKPEILGKTPQERAERYRLQSIANDKYLAFHRLAFKDDTTMESLVQGCLDNMQPMADHLGSKPFLCGGSVPSIADFILFEHVEASLVITD